MVAQLNLSTDSEEVNWRQQEKQVAKCTETSPQPVVSQTLYQGTPESPRCGKASTEDKKGWAGEVLEHQPCIN